jgi:pteridine reductase
MASPRVAVITGSGKQRVGWNVAQTLADKGYSIVIHYRSSKSEAEQTLSSLQTRGVQALLLQADLTDETAIQSLVKQTLDRFGRIDVLANCAAIWKSKKLEDITAADVRHYFDTNALSTFLCAQQVGLVMVGQPEGGCIINVGDWAVHRPYLNYAAYFVSKGAIPTLTRTLAVELGQRNPRVRVNCVLPGPVMLPQDLPALERQEAIDATLVKREGTPQHVASAVVFLVENDFVTGVCLPVDGGRSIYAP